ncbi:hypothetical protein F5972_08535 [Microbispora cellulosiformans]|uniref:Uncharacterized protein n=1 Tax=Microbispora cellulosiformans TaxID=2614688 RepID=A0A5J5K8B1_9ACTN|nr:hypothetical protein [Microbispora cellulosiformans]KAA9379689.1 hypothetical protein F5972_08535 [Microbispora cellulosiformans]
MSCPTAPRSQVFVYRNRNRRGERWLPGDRLAPAYTLTLPEEVADMFAGQVAERLRWVFGAGDHDEDALTGDERHHRAAWRAAGLPPFARGDLLTVGRWAFTWDAYGLRVGLDSAHVTASPAR